MRNPRVAEAGEIVILNWRDTGHPEGGGSELYVEELAAGLARHCHRVTLVSAAYRGAPRHLSRPDGVEVVHLGGRLSVYPRAALAYVTGRLGRPQVVIEVQNGMPFLARLWVRRADVIVLVHHVHREQWRVVMPAAPARVGWWIESWLAPRVNRRSRYVAVSETTRRDLTDLGVPAGHVTVIHNGTPPAQRPGVERAVTPALVVVSRLVPHKRIELAIDTLAELVPEFPDLTLTVAGRGWWHEQLRGHVARRGMTDRVHFLGYVSDQEKARLYQQAWVGLVPSLKEGWGLVVVEAGRYGTPSVGFHQAGGVAESIRDGATGLLAHTCAEFTDKVALLLRDAALRERLGVQAAAYAASFTWEEMLHRFLTVLHGHASAEAGPMGLHSEGVRLGSGP